MAEQNFNNLAQNLRSDNKEDDAKLVEQSISLLNQNIGSSDKTKLSNCLKELSATYQTKPGFLSRIFSGGKFNERIRAQVEKLKTTKGQVEKNLQNQNQQSSNVTKTDEKHGKQEKEVSKQDEKKQEVSKLEEKKQEVSKLEEKKDEETKEEQKAPVIAKNEVIVNHSVKRTTEFEIYQGKWMEKDVFVKKIIIPGVDQTGEQIDEQISHHLIQYKLKNENIAKLYGYCQEDHELWILLEFTSYGSLNDLIHKHKISIPVVLKIGMLRDIANAMYYLHTTPYLHRDLSSECAMIFLKNQGCAIKVTDFVNVRTLAATVTHSASKVGKELWMAPEILLLDTNNSDSEDDAKNNDIQNDGKIYQYSKQSDVWSFSIIMYEVICQKLPFLGDVGELITKLRKEKRPVVDKKIREDSEYHEVIELMKKCWAERFDARPLFAEL